MKRFIAQSAPAALVSAFVYFYYPTINYVRAVGFWYILPLLLVLAAGFMQISLWLEYLLGAKKLAPTDLHNANFPSPIVQSGDWDHGLMASPETVTAAFQSAKHGQSQSIFALNEQLDELMASYDKNKWDVQIFSRQQKVTHIPVLRASEWADTEIQMKGWRSIFKRLPSSDLTDDVVQLVVHQFFGWQDKSDDIAWCIVRRS